jgi:tetratricopeptide (TPR) repeat protein
VIGQSRWGAIAGLEELTASQRCLVAARGIGLYVQKLVWPSWLSPYFPMWENFSFADIKFLVSLVLVVGVTFVAVWQRNRAPALPAAWVSFLAMIAPVCGLFQVGAQAIADRFMYLAMLPLVLLAAAGIAWCWGRIRRVPRLAVVLFLGCYFTYFAVRTEQQIVVWRDEETLWTTVLTHFPLSGIANFHLAMALVDQHRFEEALPHAAHAVRMIGYNPLAHSTLGLVYLKTHHYAEAVAELQEALRMEPEFLASRYNLACAYARLGQIEASLATLRDLLVRQPSYAALAARENTLSALWTNTVSAARFSEMLK